jgi:hypothetical protein
MLTMETTASQGRHPAGFARRFEGRDDSGGNMNNRRKLTALVSAESLSQQLGKLSRIGGNFAATAQNTLSVLGLAAIAALTLMFFRPELTDHLKVISPFWEAYSDDRSTQEMAFASMLELPERKSAEPHGLITGVPLGNHTMDSSQVNTVEQQRVMAWLAKRYRIAQTASKMLVEAAYTAGHEVRIDPLLVLSVMAIESRFNPFAESAMGAQGLMQVMAKVHHSKFDNLGGTRSVLNPVANIQVGAQILHDVIRRSGSVEAGLKLYVGAGNLETDGGYASKVLSEYSKLQAVASGKRVPTFTPPTRVQPEEPIEARIENTLPPPRSHVEEPA